jgi:hypothetical protein
MRIDLSLTNTNACNVTFSLTDAEGKPQSVTITPNFSTVFSTSLSAQGVLSWASPAGSGFVGFVWDLEQAPAMSVGAPIGFFPFQLQNVSCGSTGTLYKNLTGAATTLNLGVSNDSPCTFSLS